MLEFILTFLVCVTFVLFLKFKQRISKFQHLPGPKPIPFIGNGFHFIGKTPEEIFELTSVFCRKYGKIFKIFLGSQVDVVLTDPKDVEVLLASQKLIEKADEYDLIADWLGTGLLISTGQKWHSRRKVLTPAFHFQILEQFVEVFDKQSRIFVNNLSKFKDREVDVFPFITLCALDIICETSMGVNINAQINSESDYVKAVKIVSGIITKRHYNGLLRSNWIFKMTPNFFKQQKYLKVLHDFTDSVIFARRDELTSSSAISLDDDVGTKKKMALLDVLLRSNIDGKPLSNADIREEVDTFMFEGHDTTTTGIAFCLYNLAKYPEVQRNVFNEIRSTYGDDLDNLIKLNDLNNMNYLELVIKESLRLYPPVPFFGRKIRKDFMLNGVLIPEGSSLGVNAFFMGRDEKIFKDPEQFIPERFLEENVNPNPFAYIPFSAGPRNCIGQKFAMLEMKSTISKVLQSFEIEVAENFEPTLVAEIILRPSNGIKLKLKRRIY